MTPSAAGNMAILDSLNLAVTRARTMLFAPFDFAVWLQIGLIAFLDALGRGTGGGTGSGGNFRGFPGGAPSGGANISDEIEAVRIWLAENLAAIVLWGAVAFVLFATLGLVILWLSSRAHMMFIHATATGRVSFGDNWRAVARPAWSLFLFRVGFAIVMSIVSFVLLGVIAMLAWPTLSSESGFAVGVFIASMAPFIAILIFVGVCAVLVMALLNNFVTPMMYHFDESALAAWGRFFGVARGNVLPIIGYLCLKIVFGIALSFATFIVGCVTLCIGMLPIVHQTIFAPYYLFERAFSLYVVQSLGPEYAMVAEFYEDVPEPGYPPPPPPPPIE